MFLAALITFRVSRRQREMYTGHALLCVCLSAVPPACPHYCTDPDVTWGMAGVPCSCALLGRIAIGARILLLCQHRTNGERTVLASDTFTFAICYCLSVCRLSVVCLQRSCTLLSRLKF